MPSKGRGRPRGRGGSGRGRGRPRKTAQSEIVPVDDDVHDTIKTNDESIAEVEEMEDRDTDMTDVTTARRLKKEKVREPSPEPVSSGDEEEKERRERIAEEEEKEEEEEEEERKKKEKKKTKNTLSPPEHFKTEDAQTTPSPAQVKTEGKPGDDEDNNDSAPRKRRRVSVSYKELTDKDGDGVVISDSPASAKHQQPARRIQPTPVEKTEEPEVLTALEQRRNAPRRTGRRGKWDENNLVTSAKSPLVNIDLVKLLAHHGAWTCLTEPEKREILSLLPENIHPEYLAHAHEPDYIIPPLPDSFLRYSNAWRDSVRQFQSDLELGRYTPKWQRDAAEASRQRALGMFDDFKEQQFEEFWGQKQKLDRSLIAGESSKIKLETLVRAGVIKVGDVWKYARIIRREKHGRETGEEVFIEKECKVIGIDDGALNFVIPPGKRVFLTQAAKDATQAKPEDTQEEKAVSADSQKQTDHTTSQSPTQGQTPDTSLEVPSDGASDGEYKPGRRLRTRAVKAGGDHCNPFGTSRSANREVTSYTLESGEIVYENITTPNQLGNRILEEDGRIKEPPNGNAWKDYRCYRNNQDMGSLWEVRHLWYTRTH